MAKTDPERARRIIAGLKDAPRAGLRLGTAGARPGRPGQAGRALGPGRVDPVDRSSGRFRGDRGTRDPPESWLPINPAASILPIVEKVAPERLEEVFWRAVALMPKDDMARERGIADFRVAEAAIFLARYDRQVADVFVTQAMASRVTQASGIVSTPGRSSGPRRVLTRGAPWR